jgi:hypothetical protein
MHALAPAGQDVITGVLLTLAPLMVQLSTKHWPTSYRGLCTKFGFESFFANTVQAKAYCVTLPCGRLQRNEPAERMQTPEKDRHLCEWCAVPAYIPVRTSAGTKYVAACEDYFFSPYEQAVAMMDNTNFDALYEEQWKEVKPVLDDPSAPQDVYSDWLNQSARIFFAYVKDTYGDIIQWKPENDGHVYLFQKHLSDYISTASNIKSTDGAKSYGAFVAKNLSLPARVRGELMNLWAFQIYADGHRVSNPLRRQEWRSRVYNEWRKGLRVWLPKRQIWRTVHLCLLFEGGDGPMLEEVLRWMNFKNMFWAFWSMGLKWIKAHQSSSHRYYPQALNMDTRLRTFKEVDQIIEQVATGQCTAREGGCHGRSSLGGGNADIGVERLEYWHQLLAAVPGTFHIVAGIIKDTLEHFLVGKTAAVRTAIILSITKATVARGEKSACVWPRYGFTKIHVTISSFIHDVPTQLYRFMSAKERLMIMCLWHFVVLIFQPIIPEQDRAEAHQAMVCFRLIQEELYGFAAAKPNHVKMA